jgi:uncharacterized protein with HEPN domain
MSDNILVLEILHQIDEALQKVKRRFENINTPDDFLDRDIISHHYFDIDAEEIFNIGEKKLDPLMHTIKKMLRDLQNNSSIM